MQAWGECVECARYLSRLDILSHVLPDAASRVESLEVEYVVDDLECDSDALEVHSECVSLSTRAVAQHATDAGEQTSGHSRPNKQTNKQREKKKKKKKEEEEEEERRGTNTNKKQQTNQT